MLKVHPPPSLLDGIGHYPPVLGSRHLFEPSKNGSSLFARTNLTLSCLFLQPGQRLPIEPPVIHFGAAFERLMEFQTASAHS